MTARYVEVLSPPLSAGQRTAEVAEASFQPRDGGADWPLQATSLRPHEEHSSSAALAAEARFDPLTAFWFDTDNHPCFLLTEDLRVARRNPASAELFERRVLTISRGALSFGRAQADEAVAEAVERVTRGGVRLKHLVVLGADEVWRGLTFHLAPFDTPLVFMSIRTQARADRLAMESLIEAFHLTPAQAKVVIGLSEGLVPKEIARRMDVSIDTVRTHLRAIYGKLKVRGIAGALRLTSQLLE